MRSLFPRDPFLGTVNFLRTDVWITNSLSSVSALIARVNRIIYFFVYILYVKENRSKSTKFLTVSLNLGLRNLGIFKFLNFLIKFSSFRFPNFHSFKYLNFQMFIHSDIQTS